MPASAAFVITTLCNICIGPHLEHKVMQALFRRCRGQPQSLSCFVSSRAEGIWQEERGEG